MNNKGIYKVSILVPIYGVEKFISKCAHSLFSQTYDNIEYVFVDDCTPDDSVKVLEDVLVQYPERKASVKIIRHEINKGLSTARNTAFDNSSGEYVMHVDSDDYLDENAIEACIDSVISTGAEIVRLAISQDYNSSKSDWPFSFTDRDDYLKKVLRREVPVTVWGVLYNKIMLLRSGVRSVDGVSFCEDYCTLPRIIFNADKVAYVTNAKYNYVMFNSGSLTNLYTHKNYLDVKESLATLENFFFGRGKEKYKNDYQVGALNLLYDMLVQSVKSNSQKDWQVLRPFMKYDISLIKSLKIKWMMKMMKWNQFRFLRMCYSFVG